MELKCCHVFLPGSKWSCGVEWRRSVLKLALASRLSSHSSLTFVPAPRLLSSLLKRLTPRLLSSDTSGDVMFVAGFLRGIGTRQKVTNLAGALSRKRGENYCCWFFWMGVYVIDVSSADWSACGKDVVFMFAGLMYKFYIWTSQSFFRWMLYFKFYWRA